MRYPEAQIENLLSNRGVSMTNVLRIAEVGSTAHGISSSNTDDDFDATVVRVEGWTELVVGDPKRQSQMIRTQPEGHRSRMGDIDLNVYTLRKFAKLAASGNPSILTAIFTSTVHHKTSRVDFDRLSRIVASKAAASAFRGYMRQQLDRWVGARGQKSVNRPELIEAYGFDTKYAAHTIRLGLQGVEYLLTGRFSMPLKAETAERIVALREGGLGERAALVWAHQVEDDLAAALESSPLPEKPGEWRKWTADTYQDLVVVERETP